MSSISDAVAELLQTEDWEASVSDSKDVSVVREVMIRCAEMMLPYWEARFNDDESMSAITGVSV